MKLSRRSLGAILSLMICLLFVVSVYGDGGVRDLTNVPIDHWSYGFLERCEAKGFLRRLADGIKPFSRAEMRIALRRIQNVRDKLTDTERGELDLLRREFGLDDHSFSEGRSRGGRKVLFKRLNRGEPLLQYASQHGWVGADFLLRNRYDGFYGMGRDEVERIYRNRLGGIVWGEAWDRIGFRIAFLQTREQGTRNYWIRDDVLERRIEIPQLKGNLADFHEGMAEIIVMPLENLRIEISKSAASWGPSRIDNLGLSNNSPTFDMIRLHGQLGIFKLVSIAGSIRPCPDRPDSPVCAGVIDSTMSYIANEITRAVDREKYLAAHRVEAAVADWLDIGFHEVVVYGDRGPQLTYLNPIMFYWAAQSYQGDKDNLMMGIDFDVHPGNGTKFYLSYVVDDLKKLRIFSDDFANKFSLQAGFLWTDPLHVDDTDFRVDYTRIEPWIYTHKFPINTFRHFDQSLGHPLGPNAEQWATTLVHRVNCDFSVDLGFSRIRKGGNLLVDGEVFNVGGDLHRGWRPGDDRTVKKFLDGNLHMWSTWSVEAHWRIQSQLKLKLSYRTESGENVPLPPRWGNNVALQHRTGYGNGSSRNLSVSMHYGHF